MVYQQRPFKTNRLVLPLLRQIVRVLGRPVRKMLRSLGYDVVAASSHGQIDARMHWLKKLGVDLVIDVGANEGQFVGWMRQRGFTGQIVSFEPQSSAFSKCKERWENDPNWHGVQTALGMEPGEIDLNIAGNSVSSSILSMLETHTAALPESAIISTEHVQVSRLDQQISELGISAKRIYLKIDTQGFEIPVLQGAGDLLENVAVLELELSLVELYDGQDLMPEVCNQVKSMGFTPVWLEQGFSNPASLQLLQVDGLFVNAKMLDAD